MTGPAAEPTAVAIPDPMLAELFRAARRSFPDECCGWLAGPRDRPLAVTRTITCRNRATPARREFRLDGDALVEFAASFDGPLPPRVVFHSHPSGDAVLSSRDRAAALAPWGAPLYPVQHLVIAVDARAVSGATLHAWSPRAGDFVEVARFPGTTG